MNCLESRRLLLVAPRAPSADHRAHIDACPPCGRFAHEAERLESAITDSLLIPVPEALTDRVLIATGRQGRRRLGAALVAAGVLCAVWLSGASIAEAPELSRTIHAVGAAHPAVAAIAEVTQEPSRAATAHEALGATDIDEHLERLGLSVPEGDARADYVGKCHIAGSAECEHIVLHTDREHASVMLMQHFPAVDRMLVSDQRLVALMSPARDGAYIVVAASAETARRIEKLLVRG